MTITGSDGPSDRFNSRDITINRIAYNTAVRNKIAGEDGVDGAGN